MTRPIDIAHLADVTGESAAVDEVRQHGLYGGRGVPVGHELRFVNRLAKRGRGHDKSQTQRGQQRLRERADVDDPPGRIEHPERLDWTPSEAELAVVIVLDDCGIVAVGPRQQRQSPRQRHRHAKRVLVGRRHVDGARLLRKGVDVETVAVDGHAAHPQAERRECPARRTIAWILHGNVSVLALMPKIRREKLSITACR